MYAWRQLVAVISVVGILATQKKARGYNPISEATFIASVVLAVCVAIAILVVGIAIPVERATTRATIQEYNAALKTLEVARAEGFQHEATAIQLKIMSLNQEIARKQYWRRSLWTNWFYDPAIEEFELLQ